MISFFTKSNTLMVPPAELFDTDISLYIGETLLPAEDLVSATTIVDGLAMLGYSELILPIADHQRKVNLSPCERITIVKSPFINLYTVAKKTELAWLKLADQKTEFVFLNWVPSFNWLVTDLISQIRECQLTPVFIELQYNLEFDKRIFRRLKDKGALFCGNLMGITGKYGYQAAKTMRTLLKYGLLDLMESGVCGEDDVAALKELKLDRNTYELFEQTSFQNAYVNKGFTSEGLYPIFNGF
ncbi:MULTISPECIES: hypothetical protein [Olivibacter]|uniref:EAL domain-containing protein n=1 Tax=Olivibacter jilunii TaxID=985016 RepID=A0ABW6BCY5_9SPHI